MGLIEKHLLGIGSSNISFLENLNVLGKYHGVFGTVLMAVDL